MKPTSWLALAGSVHALARDRLTTYSWEKAVFGSGVNSALVTFMATGNDAWAKMESAWIEVAEDVEENKHLLLAAVDCLSEDSKALCEKRFNITKYPTIMYFMPPDPVGEQYEGDQTLKAFKNFTSELLGGCYPAHRQACSDEQRLELEKMEKAGVKKTRRKFWNSKRKFAKSEDALREGLNGYKSIDTMTPEEQKAHAAMQQQKLLMSIVQRDQAITMGKSEKFRLMKAFLAQHGDVGEDPAESSTANGAAAKGKKEAPKGKARAKATAKAEALAQAMAKAAEAAAAEEAAQKDEV